MRGSSKLGRASQKTLRPPSKRASLPRMIDSGRKVEEAGKCKNRDSCLRRVTRKQSPIDRIVRPMCPAQILASDIANPEHGLSGLPFRSDRARSLPQLIFPLSRADSLLAQPTRPRPARCCSTWPSSLPRPLSRVGRVLPTLRTMRTTTTTLTNATPRERRCKWCFSMGKRRFTIGPRQTRSMDHGARHRIISNALR